MEKLARDKHSSILQKSVHYGQKSFITLAPGRSSKQTSDYGFHINLTNIRLKRSINLTNIRLKWSINLTNIRLKASNFADFLLDKYLLNLTSFKTLKFFVVWAQCYETFSEFTNFFMNWSVWPWYAFPALSNVCRKGQEPTQVRYIVLW
jgi:hypothetical protein